SAQFLKEQSVEVQWQKRSLKDFGDQSLEDLSAQFDLLIIDHPHMGVAAQSQCLLPLDNYLSDDVLYSLRQQSAGPSFDSYHYRGHQWALPIDAAFQSASYRSDLMDVPIPKTWKEVWELATKLKARGQYVGMALCPTDALCTFLSLIAQLRSPVIAEQSSLIDEASGVQVLELMARCRDTCHPDSLHWNPIQLYDHMAAQDDVAYCPMAFNYTNYSRDGFRENLLQFAPAAGGIALLGGAGIAVSSQCKRPEVAINFALWVCGAEVQRTTYTTAEGQPGNVVAWEDEVCNRLVNNFFRDTRPTLDQAYVRPRFAAWPAFQEWLGEEVHAYLVNHSDTKQLIATLNDHYQSLDRE
ncbi:MAG: extracellular solute-binding protein, partial [Bacteroidota bacterium]